MIWIGALGLAGIASGATLTVGPTGTHATIGAAISAAAAGDRIEVEPGTYPEFSQTIPFDLEIVGTGGAAVTTWEYSGGSTTVRAEGVTLTLQGFTFTGGGRRALWFRQASVATLDDIVVTAMGDGTGDGGAMYASGGAIVNATDVTFDSNNGDLGGHAYVSGATLSCVRCTMTGGVGIDGGALYGTSGAVLSLTDSTLSDNNAVDPGVALGGHVVIRNGSLVLTGGSVDGGSADRGGQIRATSSTVTATSTVFTGGTAADAGGAFAVEGGSLTLDGALVSGGTAASSGGCVTVSSGDLTLVGAEVSDCVLTDLTGSFGAGLHTLGVGVTTLIDSVVARNSSPVGGGGMRLSSDGTASLLRVTVEDNVSGFGAGMHSDSLMLTITDSTFRNNLGTHGGGLRWASPTGSLVIEDSVFEGNDGSVLGGGVYAHDGIDVVVLDTVFRDNTGGDGAGSYLQGLDTLEVKRVVYCSNVAADDGGGAYSRAVATSEVWTNNTFAENVSGDDGGALVTEGATGSRVQFNDFIGSSAVRGAVRTFETGLQFSDNLVSDTVTAAGLHAALAIPDAQVVRNTWFNNPTGDLGGAQTSWGADNQVLDPQLQIWTLDGDCSNDLGWPSLGSPLVDRGDPALTDPDGTRADVGTYAGPDADPTPFADVDGDGWILMFDCDDDDPAVYPFAADPSDGIDQNCDGLDGCDGDGDGWDPATCGGADCDDVLPGVYPDAPETAGDGVDSNCDGEDDPLPPAVDLSITIDNLSGSMWRGGVLAVLPAGGVLPSLVQPGPSPTTGDRYDSYAFGALACDPYGVEDDGDAAALISRWSVLTDAVDAFVVGDLAPGTSVTVPFTARPSEVLSFVAWVDGTTDDLVVMHQAGDVLDTTVDLFNDLGMPLFFPRFDIAGYDLNSVDPMDGTAADCAATCPAVGCYVAPGNGSVGVDAGGAQGLPTVDALQTWPGFVLDPDASPLTASGIGSPTVVYRTALDDWVMLFETNTGADPNCPVGTWAIGLATSPDGWNWTVQPTELIGPTPGTYHSCVAAHPSASLDADGSSIHVWFKAEQDDLACMTGVPPWGCTQYAGVGYAHLDDTLAVDVLNPLPALVTNEVFGYPTVMQAGAGRWVMVQAKYPELFVATANAPGGPYTLDPAPFLVPGLDSWNMTEIFNPAVVCDPGAADPLWMLYGGRTRAPFFGPVLEGGLAAATSSDLVTWLSQLPYLTFVGDLPWRHWDVVRVGDDRLVYYSQKDDQGMNHIGIAATDDQLSKSDLMARSCP